MDKKLGAYLSKLDKVCKVYLNCVNVRRKEKYTEIEATDGHLLVRLTVHTNIGVESGLYDMDTWKNLICKGYEGKVSSDFDYFPPLDKVIPDKSNNAIDSNIIHFNLALFAKTAHFVDGPVRIQVQDDLLRVDGRHNKLNVDVLLVYANPIK